METKQNNLKRETITGTGNQNAINNVLDIVSVPAYTATMATRHGTTPDHVARVIKETVMPRTRDGKPDYTEAEFALLMMTAAQYDLDPILGQIYALKLKGKFTIFLGKNAWNAIAQRDPNYDGRVYTYYHHKDGEVYESPFPTKDPLFAVKCSIYKKNRKHPASAIALVSEYKKKADYATPYDTVLTTMMEHKSFNKAAQDAFGLGDVYDEIDRDIINDTHYPPEVYQDGIGSPPDYSKHADRAVQRPRKQAPDPTEDARARIAAKALAVGADLATMEDSGLALDEIEAELNRKLAEGEDDDVPPSDADVKKVSLDALKDYLSELWPQQDADAKKIKVDMCKKISGIATWKAVEAMDADALIKAVDNIKKFREILFEKYSGKSTDPDCILAAWDEATE